MIRGVQFLILDEGVSAIDVATANEIEQELLDMHSYRQEMQHLH